MDTPTSKRSDDAPLRHLRLALRVLWSFFAVAVLYWGATSIGAFSRGTRTTYVADHIKRIEPYDPDVLQAIFEQGANGQTPDELHANAIIAERLLELDLLSAKRTKIDTDITHAQDLIVKSLKEAPSDSFLWLCLYWIRTVEKGFSEKNLPLLKMSYATGNNEGWIALRRNRLAFIVFAFLPPDIAEKAKAEFVSLVSNRFTEVAADVLVGPAWAERDQLLSALDVVPIDERSRFARQLYDMGYSLDVPGVRRSDERPWHQFER